jgi:UDP-glucose 4-epimerase
VDVGGIQRRRKLDYVALRYFNAAGATATCGEDHRPESHLIPIVLDAALGRRPSVTVFGDDYPTRDGTCVRDYIHVSDLAQAHVLALDAMARGFSGALNLGSENGFTVREVIDATERVTKKKVGVENGSRRPGDPPALVASSQRAREVLGWSAPRAPSTTSCPPRSCGVPGTRRATPPELTEPQ